MLIRFKVSNSRSIGKEIEFSAIATEDSTLEDRNTIFLPEYNIHLLKAMALLGANASGKSNIFKALEDARALIINQKALPAVYNYCKNITNGSNTPVTYSFDILINKKHYNYIFSYDKESIIEEKLICWKNNHDSEVIFSRVQDKNNKYIWQPKIFFESEDVDYFYKSTPNNKLFLTIANKPINADAIQKIDILEQIYEWFQNQLLVHISLSAPGKIAYDDLITFIFKSHTNKNIILKLLEIADIHIIDINIREVVGVSTEVSKKKRSYLYTKPNGDETFVNIITTHTDSLKMAVREFDFFTEESHGTQQFLAWIGSWLLQLQEGKQPKIFVIDELGTNLHPKLTQLLIKIFYSKKINPHNSQLLFTTHEVKLMDKGIMRPDQLYLVNKKNELSFLIRASDFKDINQYNRLDNLYMHNGLTGVPSIQDDINLDQILKNI